MEWLEECHADLNTKSTQEDVDIKIQGIQDIDDVNKSFSVLTEFFISCTAKIQNSMYSIFFNEDTIPEVLLKDVIPHFNSVKLVLYNNVPKELMLSQPKNSSVKYIKNHSKNPIIESIYNINISIDDDYEWSKKKVYKIKTKKIKKYENNDFDKILPYLNPPYDMSHIILSVSDWTLNDELKNSLAIRYFTYKYREVYLWVDKEQRVTEIQFLV